MTFSESIETFLQYGLIWASVSFILSCLVVTNLTAVFNVLQTKSGMGDLMNNAIFSMVEAKFVMGDFNQMVLNSADKAQLKARARKDNVAGKL